jgi:hypothetical protein
MTPATRQLEDVVLNSQVLADVPLVQHLQYVDVDEDAYTDAR